MSASIGASIVVVVLLVLLLGKSARARRWFAGIALLGLVVLAVAIALPHLSRSSLLFQHVRGQKPALIEKLEVARDLARQTAIPQLRRAGAGTQQSSSDSYPSDSTDLPFEPDVYASKELAVHAVARLLAEQYKEQVTSEDLRPRTITVTGNFSVVELSQDEAMYPHGDLEHEAAQAVSRVFESFSGVVSTLAGAPASQPANLQALHLNIEVRTPNAEHGAETLGLIEGTLVGHAGRFTRRVEYLNKLWSEDFETWRRGHNLTGVDWVLGQSQTLCVSREEAVQEAMQTAAVNVQKCVSAQLLSYAPNQPDRAHRVADLRRWLDASVPQQLEAGAFQTETFTQRFHRPYGSLWRHAVLVQVPTAKTKSLLDAYFHQEQAQRASWHRTLVSGAGMLAVIVVVYLFLNAATRGYYVWSVRAATVVLAAFGAWCLVVFVR